MNAPDPISPEPASAIVEYNETTRGLADLRHRLQDVVFDVTTKEGDAQARVARRECVTLRTSLEKLRKQLNTDDQARIAARNELAKSITSEIEALETPIDRAIKNEEAKVELARQAKAAAEDERVASIGRRIEWIRSQVLEAAHQPAASISSIIGVVTELPLVVELYAEFLDVAVQARVEVLARLRGFHTAAVANEREAERLAQQRRELEEQQAVARRDELVRREAIAVEDAARKAAQAAEDAERAKVRKAEDDERAAAQAEQARKEAAASAEREREEAAALADRRRQDDEAAAGRKREQTALEARADPWRALRIIVVMANDERAHEIPPGAFGRVAQDALDAAEQLHELTAVE